MVITGITQVAVALAKLLDSARAVSVQPMAARVLAAVIDELGSVPAGDRGSLAVVRGMTRKRGYTQIGDFEDVPESSPATGWWTGR